MGFAHGQMADSSLSGGSGGMKNTIHQSSTAVRGPNAASGALFGPWQAMGYPASKSALGNSRISHKQRTTHPEVCSRYKGDICYFSAEAMPSTWFKQSEFVDLQNAPLAPHPCAVTLGSPTQIFSVFSENV